MCLCQANEYFRVEIEVISGGCRTRTLSFIHDPSIFVNYCIYTIIENKEIGRHVDSSAPLISSPSLIVSSGAVSSSRRASTQRSEQQAPALSASSRTPCASGAELDAKICDVETCTSTLGLMAPTPGSKMSLSLS